MPTPNALFAGDFSGAICCPFLWGDTDRPRSPSISILGMSVMHHPVHVIPCIRVSCIASIGRRFCFKQIYLLEIIKTIEPFVSIAS